MPKKKHLKIRDKTFFVVKSPRAIDNSLANTVRLKHTGFSCQNSPEKLVTDTSFFITGMNETAQKDKTLYPIERVVTSETRKLLQELPYLCNNYKTEYVDKNKGKTTLFKCRMGPKKVGDYFSKLGFDYRSQIWYEGNIIDTYDDVEQHINKWTKPFNELSEDLKDIINHHISNYGLNDLGNPQAKKIKQSVTPKPEPISNEILQKVTKNPVLKQLSRLTYAFFIS